VSERKFNREKDRRQDRVRTQGAESVSSERWETGGTPIAFDLQRNVREKELRDRLKVETAKIEEICREKKFSSDQAVRLSAQIVRLREIKNEVGAKSLFAGTQDLLDAKDWLELAVLFVELLESGNTLSTLGIRINRMGAAVMKQMSLRGELRSTAIPTEEREFIGRFLPLYVRLRPPKAATVDPFSALQLVRRYLNFTER
jgi:hypothetical protein